MNRISISFLKRKVAAAALTVLGFANGLPVPQTHEAAAATNTPIKIGEFGSWSLFCTSGNVEEDKKSCALVQNVTAGDGSDTRAWARTTLDINKDKDLNLTIRVDRSNIDEGGVALRLDQKPVGISSLFECDDKQCKTSVVLSKNGNLTLLGTLFELSHQLSIDVRISKETGYRIPLELEHVKDAIYALLANDKSSGLGDIEGAVAQAPNGGLIQPTGVVMTTDANFKVEAMQLDTSLWSEANTHAKTPGITVPFKEGCKNKRNKTFVLQTNINVKSNLTLEKSDQGKLEQLISDSDNCNVTQYFSIVDGGNANQNADDKSLANFRSIQKMQVVQALKAAGIPSNRVFSVEGNEVELAPPYLSDK